MAEPRWCVHCDLDQARRRDGICGACNAYRHKYGQLPSAAVIGRRTRRRDLERLERLAWGA